MFSMFGRLFPKKNSNSSQTLSESTYSTVDATTPELNDAINLLYKTEFDDNGKVLHCNSYGKMLVPLSSEVIEDDEYSGKEIYEEYMSDNESKYDHNLITHEPSVYNISPLNNDVMKDKILKEGLEELNSIVGLDSVKTYITELVHLVEINKERQRIGQKVEYQTLHTIFTGSAGTGKTTVARIFGKIMRGLNIIEKGHFIEVTREDLVDDHIGGTAIKTRNVLESALGGILFIDEVYSLSQGGPNDFGKEAINTIVKFMEDYKNDLIVIIAGYTNETKDFLKANSGLKSRFANEIAFPDYTPEELLEISKQIIKNQDCKISIKTERILLELLRRKQVNGRNSGNARMARNIVQAAVRKQSIRLKGMKNKVKEDYFTLTPDDFGYVAENSFNLEAELNQIVGNEEIKEFILTLQSEVKIRKMRKEQGLPTDEQALHMILKGNPGTGKTTIARIMGKMLKELGVIKSGHVVEVTREDLVASYVGQTAPKTKEKIQEALGGILFIDEVYSLNRGGENDFGYEAIDTLVKQMEEHYENLIVIIAGYEEETNAFLATNSGLKSRFPYQFILKDYSPIEMAEIAIKVANKQGYIVPKESYKPLLIALTSVEDSRHNGNGRFARTVIEKARLNQSKRLISLERSLEKVDLQILKPEDFQI